MSSQSPDLSSKLMSSVNLKQAEEGDSNQEPETERSHSDEGFSSHYCSTCCGEGCENENDPIEDSSDDDYYPFDDDEDDIIIKPKKSPDGFDLVHWVAEKEGELAILFPEQDEEWTKTQINQVVMKSEGLNVTALQELYAAKVDEIYSAPPPVFKVVNMTPKRTLGAEDDPLEIEYNRAAEKFYHLQVAQNKRIISIDLVKNSLLKERFEEKQNQFRDQGIPVEPILAFHGAPMDNIQNIIKENFKLELVRRTVHGFGIYFSEQPEVSMGYSKSNQSLLLCKVLLGKPGVHSKEVKPDGLARCWAVVIGGSRDPGTMNQILPYCVINYN